MLRTAPRHEIDYIKNLGELEFNRKIKTSLQKKVISEVNVVKVKKKKIVYEELRKVDKKYNKGFTLEDVKHSSKSSH